MSPFLISLSPLKRRLGSEARSYGGPGTESPRFSTIRDGVVSLLTLESSPTSQLLNHASSSQWAQERARAAGGAPERHQPPSKVAVHLPQHGADLQAAPTASCRDVCFT